MSSLIPINNINVEFQVVGDEIFANSLQVAEVFEKAHSNVLKSINNLPNDEFKSVNFKADNYFDKKGEQRRMYNLTKDGFSLLVMGFTGEKAYRWKVEFIKAFNTLLDENKRLKFSLYTNKIANLEMIAKDTATHHLNVINGYKSQLSQKNAQLAELKDKLVKYESNQDYDYKTSFKKAIRQRDYYFDEFRILKQKENKSISLLNNAKSDLEKAFSKLGAIMAYINENDEFFVNRNFKEINNV
ncbi:Rha family transcriptional regulator [Campylobacter sputorum]|uniref:Rha family transcriptional regulator n=1 Tax=Campylobacter sputorum TaxID=206 RepID=UPI0006914006|nr:Rha family transcriptional regulator [Campylobacter sputorum]